MESHAVRRILSPRWVLIRLLLIFSSIMLQQFSTSLDQIWQASQLSLSKNSRVFLHSCRFAFHSGRRVESKVSIYFVESSSPSRMVNSVFPVHISLPIQSSV